MACCIRFLIGDMETTEEFQAWWAELSETEHEVITDGVTVLAEKGPRSEARGWIREQKI